MVALGEIFGQIQLLGRFPVRTVVQCFPEEVRLGVTHDRHIAFLPESRNRKTNGFSRFANHIQMGAVVVLFFRTGHGTAEKGGFTGGTAANEDGIELTGLGGIHVFVRATVHCEDKLSGT